MLFSGDREGFLRATPSPIRCIAAWRATAVHNLLSRFHCTFHVHDQNPVREIKYRLRGTKETHVLTLTRHSRPNAFVFRILKSSVLAAAMMLVAAIATANTINFDDFTLDGSGFYNGSDLGGDFTVGNGTFNGTFNNTFSFGCCWDGWSVSNHGDTATPGFGNQYSSITGGGFGGGGQFGVAFTDSANITLASATSITGTYLTNTTYSALSMLNGDSFAKQFGGASGTDEDWFSVTIEGRLSGAATSSVEFLLADYRFANSIDDYIIDEWTWVDLSSLGLVDELSFSFASSDVGNFGVNTPSYVAVDFITSIPEPGTGLLCALGLAAMARRPWRSRRLKRSGV
jgi:hypothetical protein